MGRITGPRVIARKGMLLPAATFYSRTGLLPGFGLAWLIQGAQSMLGHSLAVGPSFTGRRISRQICEALMSGSIREELVGMEKHDQAERKKLEVEGSLFDGYHPHMEAIHRAHAIRLREI